MPDWTCCDNYLTLDHNDLNGLGICRWLCKKCYKGCLDHWLDKEYLTWGDEDGDGIGTPVCWQLKEIICSVLLSKTREGFESWVEKYPPRKCGSWIDFHRHASSSIGSPFWVMTLAGLSDRLRKLIPIQRRQSLSNFWSFGSRSIVTISYLLLTLKLRNIIWSINLWRSKNQKDLIARMQSWPVVRPNLSAGRSTRHALELSTGGINSVQMAVWN